MTLFKTTAENENNSKEFKIIKKYLDKNKTVALDVGACIGNFTKFLSQNCKKVMAFEPSPANFARLNQNTKDLDNVFIFNYAVGGMDGERTLYLCPNDIGMNRLYDSQWCKDGEQVKVNTRKLDSMNFIFDYNKIDFIKLDVEGYEYYVLMGMRKLLKRDKPILLVEFHSPSILESGAEPERIWDIMTKELGYNNPVFCSKNIKGNPKVKSFDELFSITNEIPAVNLLFIPT